MGFFYVGAHQGETKEEAKVMESVIGILEGRSETEKIEVHLRQEGNAEERLDLRLLFWGEGIGWYPQKTIALDCREIDALQTILKRVKALMLTKNRKKMRVRGALVPFPLQPKEGQPLKRRALKHA